MPSTKMLAINTAAKSARQLASDQIPTAAVSGPVDAIPSAVAGPSAAARGSASSDAANLNDNDNHSDGELDPMSPRDNTGESMPIPDIPVVDGAGGLPISGTGENACIKFQLIPISETPGRPAIGEVIERSLKEKDVIKLGRQVIRDGQATIKGNKKATEMDVWFTSKVPFSSLFERWN